MNFRKDRLVMFPWKGRMIYPVYVNLMYMSTGQLFIIGTSNALYKITLKDGLSERDSNKMTIAFRGNTKYLPQSLYITM